MLLALTQNLVFDFVLVTRGVEVPDDVLTRLIDHAVLTYGAVLELAIVKEALRLLECFDRKLRCTTPQSRMRYRRFAMLMPSV